MALFKVSKGTSRNLPTELTEGYCWYTYDDSKFYIDYKDDEDNLVRKAINAEDAATLCGMSLEELRKSISWNDLLDRPFSEETIEPITWNGVVGDRATFVRDGFTFVKVSDGVLTKDQFSNGATFIFSDDSDTYITDMYVLDEGTGIHIFMYAYSFREPCEIDGITIPEAGTYFALGSTGYHVQALTFPSVIKTIDEKYLPNTLARVSDIVQADWSETYDDSMAYIRNKPFGDFYQIKRTGDETVTVTGKYTTFTLVSNDILEYEELSGVAIYSGASGSFPSLTRFSDNAYGTYSSILVITQDDTTCSQVSNNPFPNAGVYLGSSTEYAVLQVKKLPEKYIPSKFATTESVQVKIDEATANLASKEYVDSKQVQSDWSVNDETSPAYVKNRTHWVGDAYQKTLFESQNVEFLYNSEYGVSATNIIFTDSLKEGAELTVVFGNTEYPVVVQSLGINLVIGNLSIAGAGSDTGEPFVLINRTDVDWEMYAQDTVNTTRRMSVFYVTQDYHKLDKVYLPDDAILPEVSSEEEGYTISVRDGKWAAQRPVGMSDGLGTGGEIFNSYFGDFINEAGVYAHAEGETTKALGQASHTAGQGTIASGLGQYVFGTYNIEDTSESTVDWAPERGKRKYVHIVGNGTNNSKRSNAHTLDWSGNAWFAGDVKVGGTGQDNVNAKTLATTEYVDDSISALPSQTITTINTKLSASELMALADGMYYFTENAYFSIYLYDSWNYQDETSYVTHVSIRGLCQFGEYDIYVYDTGIRYYKGGTRICDGVEQLCCPTESAYSMNGEFAGMYELPLRETIHVILRQYNDGTIEYENNNNYIEYLRTFGWGISGVLTQCTIHTNNTSKDFELYEVEKLVGDDNYLYGIKYVGYKDNFRYDVLCELDNITVEKTEIVTRAQIDSLVPKITTVTLAAAKWNGNTNPWSQTITVNGVTANSRLELSPTAVQIVSLQSAEIALMLQNDSGTVTAWAIGNKPTEDYTMQVLITEVTSV